MKSAVVKLLFFLVFYGLSFGEKNLSHQKLEEQSPVLKLGTIFQKLPQKRYFPSNFNEDYYDLNGDGIQDYVGLTDDIYSEYRVLDILLGRKEGGWMVAESFLLRNQDHQIELSYFSPKYVVLSSKLSRINHDYYLLRYQLSTGLEWIYRLNYLYYEGSVGSQSISECAYDVDIPLNKYRNKLGFDFMEISDFSRKNQKEICRDIKTDSPTLENLRGFYLGVGKMSKILDFFTEEDFLKNNLIKKPHEDKYKKIYQEFGEKAYRLEDYTQAIFFYKKIVEKYPKDQISLLGLGDSYWSLGDHDQAGFFYTRYQKNMDQYSEKMPRRVVERLNNVAFYLYKNKKYQAAIEMLSSVISEAPTRAVAHLNLADAYWDSGKKSEAKASYKSYQKLMQEQGKDLSKIPKYVAERLESKD